MALRESEVDDRVPWRKAALALVVAVPIMVGSEVAYFGPLALPLQPRPARAQGSLELEAPPTSFTSLDEIPVLFDPVSGESLVWYSGDLRGSPRFFTRGPGFDPTTGEALRLLTREAIEEIQQADAWKLKAQAAQRQDAARQKAREEEAAYRARYVDPQALASMGSPQILLAVDEDELEQLLGAELQDAGYSVNRAALTRSVFEPEMFRALATGSNSVLSRLGLATAGGALVLGDLDIEEKQNPQLKRLTSVTARLGLSVVELPGGRSQTITFAEPGAGFDAASARAFALERIVEQVCAHPSITGLPH